MAINQARRTGGLLFCHLISVFVSPSPLKIPTCRWLRFVPIVGRLAEATLSLLLAGQRPALQFGGEASST